MSNIGCNVTTATTTQTIISEFISSVLAQTFGTSTNGTALVTKTLIADEADALYVANVDNEVIGPSQWIVFGYDTGTTYVGVTAEGEADAAFAQSGTCSTLFSEI